MFISNVLIAQTAFHNYGNLQIHNQGEIGFHIDLINDGVFNENLGLVGFYNTNNQLTISGTEIPRFFDVDIDVDSNLFLTINTEVSNSLNFINGDVVTPRNNPSISLDFLNNTLFILEDNAKHIDGYTSFFGSDQFSFPIGDDNRLKPLIIPFQNEKLKFSAAYFNEDPNFPSTFPNAFDTSNSEVILNNVSINEFWDFNGVNETQVTLTWNQESQISTLVNDLINLRVVGWSLSENKWLDLGNAEFTGTLNSGTITSSPYIPDEYEIITFGALIGSEGLAIYDGMSPNGDGVNDFFVIEGIELFENNLKIYDRLGRLVFKTKNYQNNWGGVANQNVFLNRNDGVPTGTYFYVLNLPTEGKNYAGPIYIQR